jgi:hypothetical protein
MRSLTESAPVPQEARATPTIVANGASGATGATLAAYGRDDQPVLLAPPVIDGAEIEQLVARYHFKKPAKARRRILKAVRALCQDLGKKQKTAAPPLA